MDALGIAEASVVADVGAGGGWFTIRLARRVGPNGIVYAEDVQDEMITAITRRVQPKGSPTSSRCWASAATRACRPSSLDAVLMVDAYREIEDRVTMLSNLARALKPQGRLGVVDFKLEGAGPGPATEERVSPDVVVKDAQGAGLRLIRRRRSCRIRYFDFREVARRDQPLNLLLVREQLPHARQHETRARRS